LKKAIQRLIKKSYVPIAGMKAVIFNMKRNEGNTALKSDGTIIFCAG